MSMGPLPDTDTMVFKALQTYSDNEVSRWIEEPQAGAEEPENPAPVLKLVAGSSADVPSSPPAAAAAPDEDSDGPALILALVALVAALGGLVLGGLAFARSRRAS